MEDLRGVSLRTPSNASSCRVLTTRCAARTYSSDAATTRPRPTKSRFSYGTPKLAKTEASQFLSERLVQQARVPTSTKRLLSNCRQQTPSQTSCCRRFRTSALRKTSRKHNPTRGGLPPKRLHLEGARSNLAQTIFSPKPK